MEELIKQIAEKFGIEADKANEIVQHVLEFVKGKLPDGLSGLVSSLGGEDGAGGSGLLDKAKELLGGFLK